MSVCQSESEWVPGSGRDRDSPAIGECARQGQWPGPVLAGAAVAASQCRGRASESAVTGHEWPHADGAPVGTVLEPFMHLALVLCIGPRPRGSARGRRRAGSRPRAPSSPVCGPASLFGFIPGRPCPSRCTLRAVHLRSMLLTTSAKRRRFVVFFLQPFHGRHFRGTQEPHPWPSGPARRPGFQTC